MRGCQTVAMVVVRERREDAAVRRCAAAPGLDHVRQLGTQNVQTLQLALYVCQLRTGDFVRCLAGWLIGPRCKIEQRADGVEWKAEFARVPNEVEAFQVASPIRAVPSRRAGWDGKDSNLLVPADRLHLAAGMPGEFADRQGCVCH